MKKFRSSYPRRVNGERGDASDFDYRSFMQNFLNRPHGRLSANSSFGVYGYGGFGGSRTQNLSSLYSAETGVLEMTQKLRSTFFPKIHY